MKIYEEETGLTNFTKEERIANLEKAMQMRKERAEIRKALTDGKTNVVEIITLGRNGKKAYAGMRVMQMIKALPGYGMKKAQAIMKDLGIAESKRVGGLGKNQATALIARLGGE